MERQQNYLYIFSEGVSEKFCQKCRKSQVFRKTHPLQGFQLPLLWLFWSFHQLTVTRQVHIMVKPEVSHFFSGAALVEVLEKRTRNSRWPMFWRPPSKSDTDLVGRKKSLTNCHLSNRTYGASRGSSLISFSEDSVKIIEQFVKNFLFLDLFTTMGIEIGSLGFSNVGRISENL